MISASNTLLAETQVTRMKLSSSCCITFFKTLISLSLFWLGPLVICYTFLEDAWSMISMCIFACDVASHSSSVTMTCNWLCTLERLILERIVLCFYLILIVDWCKIASAVLGEVNIGHRQLLLIILHCRVTVWIYLAFFNLCEHTNAYRDLMKWRLIWLLWGFIVFFPVKNILVDVRLSNWPFSVKDSPLAILLRWSSQMLW